MTDEPRRFVLGNFARCVDHASLRGRGQCPLRVISGHAFNFVVLDAERQVLLNEAQVNPADLYKETCMYAQRVHFPLIILATFITSTGALGDGKDHQMTAPPVLVASNHTVCEFETENDGWSGRVRPNDTNLFGTNINTTMTLASKSTRISKKPKNGLSLGKNLLWLAKNLQAHVFLEVTLDYQAPPYDAGLLVSATAVWLTERCWL